MANYQITIRANVTCPAKDQVVDMVEKKATAFKSIISNTQVRKKYPVYIDEYKPENLYGFVDKVRIGNDVLDDTALLDLIATKPDIKLEKVEGAIFSGTVTVKESKNNAVNPTYVSERLQKVMDEKIAEGIVSAEEMETRLKYMQRNRVAEPVMYKLINRYRKYNKAVHTPRTIYEDPFLTEKSSQKEGLIAEGLRCSVLRMPTICEGEKSVGKNVYMETLAWLMGMPLYMIGFSRNMNPNSIYGEKSTDNSASEALRGMGHGAIAKVMLETNQPFKNEHTRKDAIEQAAAFELNKAMAASVSIITDASELYDWMTDGGVMVFNEMNMAESNFFSSFANPLTDGTGFLFFPGRGEVKMHKDCVLFGTQNADYEGVMQQNEATMSRFNTLHFEQPRSVIRQFKAATNAALKADGNDFVLPDKYFVAAEKFYQHCMDAVHEGHLSNAVLNIRGFVRALTVVADSECTCPLSRWLQVCVIDSCPADEQKSIVELMQATVVI